MIKWPAPRNFYYKTDANYKVKVMVGDKVKVSSSKEDIIYEILSINDMSMSFDFGTCYVLDETHTEGYYSIGISNLIFIDRDFYDPEHF